MGGVGGENIYWWVMYDISSPKRLRRMTKLCRQNGLRRIQKSVYLGKLTQKEAMELRKNILNWLPVTEDRVMMMPVGYRSMRAAVSLGDDTALTEVMEDKAVVCL